jgi:hypothetical protein
MISSQIEAQLKRVTIESILLRDKLENSVACKKHTIKKHIMEDNLYWYGTITFKPKKQLFNGEDVKNIVQAWQKFAQYNHIKYCLCHEYTPINNILHFHGVFNFPLEDIQRLIIDGKKIKDRFGNAVFENVKVKKTYGINSLIDIRFGKRKVDFKDIKVHKIIRYILKYMIKEGGCIYANTHKMEFELEKIALNQFWYANNNMYEIELKKKIEQFLYDVWDIVRFTK